MTPAIIRELERILSEPVSSVVDRERNTLGRLLEDCGHKVVLFGAGRLGRQTLLCLRSVGIVPIAISDNNPALWGTQFEGIQVLAPEVAATRFGRDALFIVTIWNSFHWYSDTRAQLETLGCERITAPFPVYWRFADTLLPFYSQDLPHKLSIETDAILDAASIWSDDKSREEYLGQIAWRSCGASSFARRQSNESYFLPDTFELVHDEVFVDCGAFDGDTLRAYLARRQDDFRYFIAIEPDKHNFARLHAYVASLAPELRRRISVLNCAVGAKRTMISFQDAAPGSPSKAGPSLVLSMPISEVVNESMPITFLKMDIEGAEHDALLGARAVIERDRPVLAVCVYHTQYDLWRVPLLIKSMVQDYQMYLRCHEGDGWQTVAYAVPPDRLPKARLR